MKSVNFACVVIFSLHIRWPFRTGTRSNVLNVSWQSRCFQTCFYDAAIHNVPPHKDHRLPDVYVAVRPSDNRAIEVMQPLAVC